MNGPHIMIFGNLTRDPVLRYTTNQGTPFVQVGVATNTYHGPDEPQDTYFFDATLWRSQAESIARNCRKGQDVFIMGRYGQREFERRDGSIGIAYQVDVKEFRYTPRGQGELGEAEEADPADNGDEASAGAGDNPESGREDNGGGSRETGDENEGETGDENEGETGDENEGETGDENEGEDGGEGEEGEGRGYGEEDNDNDDGRPF